MYDYVLINSSHGLLRDIDGVVRPLDLQDPEQFPATLEDDSFDATVSEVRQVVAAQQQAE